MPIPFHCQVHQLLRYFPKFLVDLRLAWISANPKKPSQHTHNIAVQNRLWLIEGNAANRPGGVSANAGKCQQLIELLRKPASVVAEDDLRRTAQIPRSLIVSQSRPEFVNLFIPGFGQGLNGGQGPHPPFPIGDHGFDLGLLEHDFGNPDGIGIARTPPWQVARTPVKPVEQCAHDRASLPGDTSRMDSRHFGFRLWASEFRR